MIDAKNWTYCQYNSLKLKAFISLTGEPSEALDGNSHQSSEVKIGYTLTLTDEEFKEIYQETFSDLQMAADAINQKYGHWNLLNLLDGTVNGIKENSSKDEGCDSCQAH